MRFKRRFMILLIAAAFVFTGCAESTESTVSESETEIISVPDMSISEDTVMLYPYAANNLCIDRTDGENGYWLYWFGDELTAGFSEDGSVMRYTEMHYGIRANVEGRKVHYSLYNNTDENITADKAYLISDYDKTEVSISFDKNIIDTADYDNGLYLLTAEISGFSLSMGVYVNKGKTYLCALSDQTDEQMEEYSDRVEKIAQLLDENGITPENSTDISDLCYPWYAYDDEHRDDTQTWADFADTLVEDDWTDERKVLAFHEWLTENIAFDYYRTEVLGKSRAMTYGIYSGKYSMWNDHIGVCFDFQNVLTIMCRAQGIPAVSIDTDTHTWNLVYLSGRWIEIDMTQDIKRAVYGEDVNDVENADETVCYDGYCTVNANSRTYKDFTGINICLWTTAKAKGEEVTPYTRTN